MLSKGECAGRLFAKNVNELLLETSMQIAFADFTEPAFEPDNLSEPEGRTSISALQTRGIQQSFVCKAETTLLACINITLFAKFLKQNKI